MILRGDPRPRSDPLLAALGSGPPSLPTLTDGLRTEEVIEAARRSITLDAGRPWADEGALEGNNGD